MGGTPVGQDEGSPFRTLLAYFLGVKSKRLITPYFASLGISYLPNGV